MQKSFHLIMVVVNKGFADIAMEAARAAGAGGGTIVSAKGAGAGSAARFYGVTIHPEKEVLMILAGIEAKRAIMQAIAEKVGISTPGQGIAFSMPVSEAIGLAELSEDDENT